MVLLQTQAEPWYAALSLMNAIQAAALLLFGLPLVYLVSRWIKSFVSGRFSPGQGLLVGKVFFLCCTGVLAMMVLQQLGFQLTALLATLGIGGVALAFAAQTSVSNVISGLFIILENSFSIGDFVKVGDVTGEVLSIDLMSVKIRTFDNKFVRVPNESLVKNVVTNLSRFPVRRVEISVPVSYRENLNRVMTVLLDIASKNSLALAEPEPFVSFEKFGDSSIELFFAVWAQRKDFFETRSSLMIQIKERFAAEGIEIPFPQMVVHDPSDARRPPAPCAPDPACAPGDEPAPATGADCTEKHKRGKGTKRKN